MILFCEECGKKNILDDKEISSIQAGFSCQYCDFLTPSSSLLYQLQRSEPSTIVDQPSNITWFPDRLCFGKVDDTQVHTLQLQFLEPTKEEFNLAAEVIKELSNDIEVRKVDEQTFSIHLVQMEEQENMLQQSSFKGVAILFHDAYSNFSCEISVEFERTTPILQGLPSKIDLGEIYSGLVYHDYLVAENSGNKEIKLHIKPEPSDFTIAARFVIEDALAVTMAPRERRKIAYSLWPIEDITEDWEFSQHIYIRTNGSESDSKKQIELRGKIIAPLN